MHNSRKDLPENLQEGMLEAASIQALAQVVSFHIIGFEHHLMLLFVSGVFMHGSV